MMKSIFGTLSTQLRAERKRRKLSQSDLAMRLGRDRARISELERDLTNNRLGRDRLTLFAEMCDALDLVPILVSRSRVTDVRRLIDDSQEIRHSTHAPTAFEELFVDLDENE